VAYLPEFSQGAIQIAEQAINAASDASNIINAAVQRTQNLMDTVKTTLPGNTKQEQAFSALRSMFNARETVTIETPWGYFGDMAIMSLTAEQDGKTKMISDLSLTLKQLTFADVKFVQLSAEGRSEEKKRPKIDKGKAQGSLIQSAALSPWASMKTGALKTALNSTVGG
jgi:hypothetical protein